jgi:flagellar biosynthesis protein FliR
MVALQSIPTIGDWTVGQFELWLLVLIRVSVLIFMLPILMTGEIPGMLKAGIAFFISILLFPALPVQTLVIPDSLFGFTLLAMRELYVGAVMGFAGTFVFTGIRIAGNWIDQETGFSMIQMYNPLVEDEDSALGHLIFIIFTLMLLSTGAYRFYLQVIGESFQSIPLGGAHTHFNEVLKVYIEMSAQAFSFGIRAASPIVVTLFMSSIALAVVSRMMPQMNVWMLGMPLKIALGLMTTIFALPLMWQVFLKEQERLQWLNITLLKIMGH